MSKGSARRPESDGSYSAGYDAIFGRKADQAYVEQQRAERLQSTQRPEANEVAASGSPDDQARDVLPAVH